MKLVNFILDGKVNLGISLEKGIVDIKNLELNEFGEISSIEDLIKNKENVLSIISNSKIDDEHYIDDRKIIYAPCVLNPQKIICVGLNYLSHSKECKMDIPEYPVLFSKFNNALASHNQIIELPKSAEKFDYEAELVIIIGKEAADVSVENAMEYVFGYTAGNDLSARDLQMRTGQWLLGKTCDGFAPIGPVVVTSDEVNPDNLDIKCMVNGEIRQHSNTSDMIFNCAEIISYISKHMTLFPGDIIFTGTPSGVILGHEKGNRVWLKSGDKVEVIIENIGTLTNLLK
ncbi:MAG: fumarylacetoacetate hydrolase family protein [Proteocatella sp.]